MNKTLLLITGLLFFVLPLAYSDTYINTTIDNASCVSDEANNAIVLFVWFGLGLLLLITGQVVENAFFFFAGGAWFIAVAGIAVFDGTYINSVFYFLLAIGSVYHGVNYVMINKNEENQSKDPLFRG